MTTDRESDGTAEIEALKDTWTDPHGWRRFFVAVDHKIIGRRFILTAFVYFALGGLLAAVMRLQLAWPENDLVGPDLYNQIFTMHGTTMMFLFATPIMLGVAIYIVPLMIGARAIAFPRLVAFAYWMFLFAGVFLYVSFVLNTGPDNGWFNYPPLSGPEFGVGKRSDIWSQFITFSEVSSLAAAVAIAATILKLRTPGMSLNRMPLYVWSMLIVSLMVIFAMPAVMLASSFLIMDRLVGTHLFNQAEAGDPVLWQHLFWFFGHPDVYIFFLPAQGMMSVLIATFTRRPVFGYTAIVLSLATTAFVGFGVWVHHMFATGLPRLGLSFFMAASILIAVPTGVQIFCWIATIWSGRVTLKTPMLYALAFFAVFVIGGLTGVMLAAGAFDQQAHDTFFVVAHLHYVMIGGGVFPLLGAMHYWFPKITGRLLSERLGWLSFGTFFVGFNLTFFPMHQLGLEGMPRRVYTYQAGLGWEGFNLAASAGAALMFVALLIYLANVLVSLRAGAQASANPWESSTLEWAARSPPQSFNFNPQPAVTGADPLWDPGSLELPIVTGLATDSRQVLVTRVLTAEPAVRSDSPDPSPWPFLTAVAVSGLFVWSIFSPWGVVWGLIPVTAALIGWFWPKPSTPHHQHAPEGRMAPESAS